jgi:hypothetical protein
MIDPDSRHGRELKAAEEFFALARITPSPFMRSYYRRVAERYLSSEGELRAVGPSAGFTGRLPGLQAAPGSATSPPHEPPRPAWKIFLRYRTRTRPPAGLRQAVLATGGWRKIKSRVYKPFPVPGHRSAIMYSALALHG